MPLIKSAIKKVRKDKKRTGENARYVKAYHDALKKLKSGTGDVQKLINHFYSVVDRAMKKNVIHKNKANRWKSKVKQFVKKSAKSTARKK